MMLVACFIFLAWIFRPYLQGNPGWIEYSVIASILLIVIFATIPAWLKQDIFNFLKDGVGWLKDVALVSNHALTDVQKDGEQVTFGIEKTPFFPIMHFLFFMTAGYILLRSVHEFAVTKKLYDLFTLAVITECMQVFVDDRGPSLVDVGVDMAGVMVAYLVWVYWGKAKIGAR